jgi:hypothetical protein
MEISTMLNVDVISCRNIYEYTKKYRLSSRLRTGKQILTIRLDTLFGAGNEFQSRSNENTQQKIPRITDRIKQELFPS